MTESDGQNGRGIRALRLTVTQDGSGGYDAVGAALTALGNKKEPPTRVYIKKGVYRERLEIERPGITLENQTAGGTVITCGLSTGMTMEDGNKRGTFHTYSVLMDTHDFTTRSLTIENSTGPGEAVGQALVLYAGGDRILFEGCRLLGGQDTLFTGPLPPKEVQKNEFIESRQFLPRINGRHCYRDCFIRGDVDSIFGSTTAYFDRCELYSAGRDTEREGYVIAASTPRGQKYGYVFRNCRFTGNNSRGGIYLGRPWRDHARTMLVDCCLGPHIYRERWHDWGKKDARSTLFYGEYGNYGPGVAGRKASEQGKGDRGTSRPDWIPMPTRKQIQDCTMEQVLGGADGWNPRRIL